MSDFAVAFGGLKARFVERCADDLRALRDHLAGNPLDPGALRLILHRLAGAAGTFGFADVSRAAGAAEDAVLLSDPDQDDFIAVVAAQLTPVVRPSGSEA